MRARTFTIAACLVLPRPALGEEENKPPTYDESALKAALEEKPGARKTHEKAGDALEVPPPPPRKSGVVVEGSIGAMGFLGKLKNISPTASTFHLQLGFEPFRWFMVFGEGDLGFTSTRYAAVARGYAIYGVGAGGRVTVGLSDRVSVYGQVDFGMMEASNDELGTYGFRD